jgi:hypothetical protein
MPNWYLNSVGWIVSFLRYAPLRPFWTLRGPGRHNVIKKYRGGLKALKAHTSPRCGGLKAHKALKAHTSPRCGGLKAHKALKAHTSPRCGGLRHIRRLGRTLPPAAVPHASSLSAPRVTGNDGGFTQTCPN